MSPASVGVVVITHDGRDHLERCLHPVLKSPLRPSVLVVNSSSGDGTVELAETLGAETLIVPRESFDHGATRELARRRIGTDVVALMTPDAYPSDRGALGRLVAPVLAGKAAVAYGRQVPRPGAQFFESFMRTFNYPAESHVRSLADAEHYGPYLFFCSNAFAAYDTARLDEVGGFRPTLSHEDALATAMLLRAGHRIAYVADAVVEHSHPYTLIGDFGRYFDAGYARSTFGELLEPGGSENKLGARYARALIHELARSRPWLLPYAGLHLGVKLIAFQAGRHGHRAPIAIKRALSGQSSYWNRSVERLGGVR